ncbi:MAG: ATP-binding protein [Gemmatimonadaceae bacterium]|nr:ATP-binding protein [Gemmatimonadaceae bacterium]
MEHVREWTLATDVQRIPAVIDEIVGLCRAAGYSARHCQLNVPVAVTEAIANAMLRGNGNAPERRVLVLAVVSEHRLLVEVTDEGPGFDLGAVSQSPDDADWFERERGRGVFLMRSLMDLVENDRVEHPHGHRLRLTLHRA